jgi:farnesyl-diphosphate farnesyltransferase
VQTAESFCRLTLPEVSRTFALNIPVLPEPLDLVVTVAYLLCRIADTLEDETEGPAAARRPLLVEFARLCQLPADWRPASQVFATAAERRLRPNAPEAEVRLLRGTRLVVEALDHLDPWARPSIARCVRVMTEGMAKLMQSQEGNRRVLGLADLDQTLTYCYYVAGIVGEMLTDLFSEYSPRVKSRSAELVERAPAFGRALQLTNILRDAREDLDQGRCFLPRREMAKHGLTVETLLRADRRGQAVALFDELIGVARREADVALEYTLALPPEEKGIRLFCLWPLFFAVLTLRELEGNPAVLETEPIKISRETVQRVVEVTQKHAGSDQELRGFYRFCNSRLPEGISTRA